MGPRFSLHLLLLLYLARIVIMESPPPSESPAVKKQKEEEPEEKENSDRRSTLPGAADDVPNTDAAESSPIQILRRKFRMGFNDNGVLKQLHKDGSFTDKGFEFNVNNGNHKKNQARYEEIGKLLDRVVFELLEKEGLLRIPTPTNGNPQSFFFASSDAATADKLMVLIHGSGVVRAGQWARRLIINENLDCGTQLPFIRRAKKLGFAVIVLNTNENVDEDTEERIPGSANPVEHARTVWREHISPAKARHVAVIAHSFGGIVTLKLAKTFEEDFMQKVFSISLTDSVHSTGDISRVLLSRLQEIGLDYVTSKEPVNTPVSARRDDIPAVSAGHEVHEWTSFTAMEAIFARLKEQIMGLKDEL